DGELGRCREFHLLKKYELLHVTRGVIVEIVEANLAPSNDFRVPREGDQLVEVYLRRKRGFVRVDTDRGIDSVILLSELDRAVEGSSAGSIAVADGEHSRDPCCLCPCEHVWAIAVEAFIFRMTVRVGVHGAIGGSVPHEKRTKGAPGIF